MFIGIGIQNIMEISKYDACLSILIGIIIGFIPIFSVMYMNKKNINLLDLINNIFNKTTSKIIQIIIILFLMYTLLTLTNDFVNFANVKYLFETPNLFIAILFILPALYISHKGVETIGRTGIVLFFIGIVLFLINSLALIKLVELDNLKPLLSSGIFNILKGSMYYVIYAITPIIFLGIIPKNNESYKKYNKKLLIGYGISSISLLIITFFVMTIFNYEYISLFSYPAYFTLKKINYGFIANVENLLSFYFIIDYFMSMLILLYSIFYFLNHSLKIKDMKLKITSIIITIFIMFFSTFAFKDTTLALIATKTTYIICNGILILLFIIIIPIKIKLHKNQ